jgi:hypothetical protein
MMDTMKSAMRSVTIWLSLILVSLPFTWKYIGEYVAVVMGNSAILCFTATIGLLIIVAWYLKEKGYMT